MRDAIEAVGAWVLYLPLYSPDFNQIEIIFAMVKVLLWMAAAQTAAELTLAIENAFAAVRRNKCQNYLTVAGYDADEPTLKGTALRASDYCDMPRNRQSRKNYLVASMTYVFAVLF